MVIKNVLNAMLSDQLGLKRMLINLIINHFLQLYMCEIKIRCWGSKIHVSDFIFVKLIDPQ